MSGMTQDPESCPTVIFTVDHDTYQLWSNQYQAEYATIGLLAGLYGVLATLSMISIYALLKRQSGKIQLTPVLLCLTILTLFTSTTTYVVICITYDHFNLMGDFLASPTNLWFLGPCGNFFEWSQPAWLSDPSVPMQNMMIQACTSAGSLTINVTLGDAIVCWRTCVVWNKNHRVKAICSVFLMATFILGIIDTYKSCQFPPTFIFPSSGMNIPGKLFEGIPVGIAICILSLSTNILATLLVACKAWQSRRRLKIYMVAKARGSQVEKLLALLIESGAVYSCIWSVVVAFQVGQYRVLNLLSISDQYSNFLNYFGIMMDGGLVPTIAIYPTVIIVLVALNRSHMERGITQHLDSIATPNLGIAVNTITASVDESRVRISEVLIIDHQDPGRGDTLQLEDARGVTREEQKTGRIVYTA